MHSLDALISIHLGGVVTDSLEPTSNHCEMYPDLYLSALIYLISPPSEAGGVSARYSQTRV